VPRLPLASRQDILDELADIQRERDAIVGTVGDRADEQRAILDWWEQDLEEQLVEMSADPTAIHRMTEHELRAGVNEFTEDDPPPYGAAR
jgi:phytoene/squalene synthetase